MTDQRIRAISARLKDHSVDELREAFIRLNASDRAQSWASFDWLMRTPDNLLKVIEGQFDNSRGSFNGNGRLQIETPIEIAKRRLLEAASETNPVDKK